MRVSGFSLEVARQVTHPLCPFKTPLKVKSTVAIVKYLIQVVRVESVKEYK
jgi:hypothetical protein